MVASKVFIARHGERIDHVDRTWYERAENPHDPFLTETGLKQAECLAKRLLNEGIKEIYVSPFYRTVQTAAAVSKAAEVRMLLEPGMCEALFPVWFPEAPVLKTTETIAQEFPSIDPTYKAVAPMKYPETEEEMVKRVTLTARKVAADADGPILLVGHGITCEYAARALVNTTLIPFIDYCSLMECVRTEQDPDFPYVLGGTGAPDISFIDEDLRYELDNSSVFSGCNAKCNLIPEISN